MAGETIRTVNTTGVTYHEDMVNHYSLWDPNHPECPQRFAEIIKRCEALNLLDRCKYISPREALPEEIQRFHSKNMITLLQDCQTKTADELEEISSYYDSIYICRETYRLAMLAAGSTIELVKALCNDEIKNGMAIVRPPGHHALQSEYCGYCFFNNVALAAEYALRKFNLSRILIVDWDVHHGQATQRVFYDDPRVLYFSIHRFDHGKFWPNLRESNADYIGYSSGEGFNFNVPLNKIGLGNADYITIFHQILLPVAVEYQPELIIVSAGFDPAVGCPEGEMNVTPACFAHFVNSLSHLANGKIAVVLEGGYFVKSLAEGAALCLKALLADPCPDIGPVGEIDESTRETILNVIYTHKNYWNCFKMYDTYPSGSSSLDADCFQPSIKFEHEEERIEKYPTRDCYPTRAEEIENFYSSWVDELIKNTKLRQVQYHCTCFSPISSKNYNLIRSLKQPEGRIIDVAENTNLEQVIPLILNSIVNNETGSVIFDVGPFKSYDFVCENGLLDLAIRKYDFKRVLFIDFKHQMKTSNFKTNSENRILHFSFAETDVLDSEKWQNDFEIYLPWTKESVGDQEFLVAWFKILLPISYQFNPDLIVISIKFGQEEELGLSVELYAYFVHWLTSLASGRVIVISDVNFENKHAVQSFLYCHRILLHSPVPSLRTVNRVVSFEFVNNLKLLAQRLRSHWMNLNFFEKLSENAVN